MARFRGVPKQPIRARDQQDGAAGAERRKRSPRHPGEEDEPRTTGQQRDQPQRIRAIAERQHGAFLQPKKHRRTGSGTVERAEQFQEALRQDVDDVGRFVVPDGGIASVVITPESEAEHDEPGEKSGGR